MLKDGGLDTGMRRHDDHSEFTQPDCNFRFFTSLGELAKALAGRVAEALSLVEAGIERSQADRLLPELLRLDGEAFMLQSPSAVVKRAEGLFRQAPDIERRQVALAWGLRAATS